jgi:ferritin-like metal-binding protein YciE
MGGVIVFGNNASEAYTCYVPIGHSIVRWADRAHTETEHYEMVSYQGLITLAGEMGNQEAVSLLSENLAEEENAARLLEREGKIRTVAETGSRF